MEDSARRSLPRSGCEGGHPKELPKTNTELQSRIRMRVLMAGCVMVVCLVVLLTDRTEGHITFFSPKEMMLMKERDGRKEMEPRLVDAQFEEVNVQQLPRVERGGNPGETVKIGMCLSPKQLDHGAPALDEILHEIVEKRQKGPAEVIFVKISTSLPCVY
ncbi:hypothetical protein Q5P01_001944 [Channa striata]|uniref:Uncharacterized protein n=1 Tax=Channa striata TaxID=64152 RepID=A0AA88T398_CHASR|nr:hypothetical protein Q5P01_001944 [Channa striata]